MACADQSAMTISNGNETYEDTTLSLTVSASSSNIVSSCVTIPIVPEESKARIKELMSGCNKKIATFGEVKLMTEN